MISGKLQNQTSESNPIYAREPECERLWNLILIYLSKIDLKISSLEIFLLETKRGEESRGFERSFSSLKKLATGSRHLLVPPPRGKRGEAFGYFRVQCRKGPKEEPSSERDHLTRDCARGSMNLDHRRHVVRLEEGEIDRRTGRGAGGEGPRGGAGGGERAKRDTAFSSVDGGEC